MEQQPNQYLTALQNHRISVEWMANHLASKGIGTPEKWQHAIATGSGSAFSEADKIRARMYFESNPQLVRQLDDMVARGA